MSERLKKEILDYIYELEDCLAEFEGIGLDDHDNIEKRVDKILAGYKVEKLE